MTAAVRGSGRRIFRILVVCTGNLCRSPAAERLLAALLVTSRESAFDLASAGVRAQPGLPIHPGTQECLRRRGIPTAGHASHPLTEADVRTADLVLTAERAHRGAVLAHDPAARARTFTVLEFALTAPAALRAGVLDPRDLVAAADVLRGGGAGGDPGGSPLQLDLPDPVDGSPSDHEAAVRLIQQAVPPIAEALRRTAR